MSRFDDKLEARLRALMELARRGVGGEADNAQAMLERLLEKHGATISDIADDEKTLCWFGYRTKHEKRVIIHITARAVEWENISYHTDTRRVGFKLTKAQAICVSEEIGPYLTALREELNRATKAFIYAQRLARPLRADEEDAQPEPTPEEHAEIMRLLAMKDAMKHVEVRRAIASPKCTEKGTAE
jgi:hypothetical protein